MFSEHHTCSCPYRLKKGSLGNSKSEKHKRRNRISPETYKVIYIPITKEILKLHFRFMEERNTPIERPPMLGFKQSETE